MHVMTAPRDSHDALARQRHLAALEALFAPKNAEPAAPPSTRTLARLVTTHVRSEDPERARLVARLQGAEGPEPVRRAARALERAGHSVPQDQETQLRMLQHPDEARVRVAMETLASLFDAEPPRRRPVLEARLRRVEDLADDRETRELATALRKKVLRPLA